MPRQLSVDAFEAALEAAVATLLRLALPPVTTSAADSCSEVKTEERWQATELVATHCGANTKHKKQNSGVPR